LKIILDTNILISASLFGGLSADILEYCFERDDIYISEFILEEYKRILIHKFEAPENTILSNIKSFSENFQLIEPENEIPNFCKDKDDNSICQVAEYIQADYIITGDKEFQSLAQFKNTKILSPREFWVQKDNR